MYNKKKKKKTAEERDKENKNSLTWPWISPHTVTGLDTG